MIPIKFLIIFRELLHNTLLKVSLAQAAASVAHPDAHP